MITIPVVPKTKVRCVCGHLQSSHVKTPMSVPLPEGGGASYPKSWKDAILWGIGKMCFNATYDHDRCRYCGCCAFEQDPG